MNNDRNKNILKFVILILGILLIIIGFSIVGNKNNDNSHEQSNQKEEETNIKDQIYVCENEINEEDTDYVSYQIETVYVKKGVVKKTVPTMKIVCDDNKIYTILKNDKEYSEGKNFDDKNLTITFVNGEEVSLENDINGNKTEVKYSDYEKVLKNAGYTCKLK